MYSVKKNQHLNIENKKIYTPLVYMFNVLKIQTK